MNILFFLNEQFRMGLKLRFGISAISAFILTIGVFAVILALGLWENDWASRIWTTLGVFAGSFFIFILISGYLYEPPKAYRKMGRNVPQDSTQYPLVYPKRLEDRPGYHFETPKY